jgi:hypothetical protein
MPEAIAVVTGANSGIGKEIARQLLAASRPGPTGQLSGPPRQRGGPTMTFPYFSDVAGSGVT